MENDTLILSRYRITEPLGAGGFSKVFRAFDDKIGRDVAVKVIRAGKKHGVRALQEAKTVALLNHPNIVTLYEFEQDEEAYYLVMEYVRGQNLADLLSKSGPLPVDLAIALARQVCDALEAAHIQEIIHRDIKPANLRVMEDGRVKVMDFGIARLLSAAKTGEGTSEGEVVGTFAYMSPEQAAGEVVDARSDIFSLGVLIYQLVTGELPFLADTPAGTIRKIIEIDPVPPDHYNADVSPELSALILTAMAKDAAARPASANALRDGLDQVQPLDRVPTEIVKEAAWFWRPQSTDSKQPLNALRRLISDWFGAHEETVKAVGFGLAAALAAAWSDKNLPFFLTRFSFFLPMLVFFLALFIPTAGLIALLAIISAGLWELSPYLGALGLVFSIIYWITIGRAFPQIAIIPLVTPALAWLNVPFILPVAAGLMFSPILAAVMAGLGAFFIAAAELISESRYAWMISSSPDLISRVEFGGSSQDLNTFRHYLQDQPWLLAQIAIWSGTAVIVAATAKIRFFRRRRLPGLVGLAALTAPYYFLPMVLKATFNWPDYFLRPMLVSAIILSLIVFIFDNPTDRSDL